MRSFDFSNWQPVLATLIGIAVFGLVGIGSGAGQDGAGSGGVGLGMVIVAAAAPSDEPPATGAG